MTDYQQGYLMGFLGGMTVLIVLVRLRPQLQSLWGRLHQRRDILDPPTGLSLVFRDGRRFRVFARYQGRSGWKMRMWVVDLPEGAAQLIERGEARLHAEKVPANAALVFGGWAQGPDAEDRPGPMV